MFKKKKTSFIVKIAIVTVLFGLCETALAIPSKISQQFRLGCIKASTDGNVGKCFESHKYWYHPKGSHTYEENFIRGCRAQLIIEGRNNNIDKFVAICDNLYKKEKYEKSNN